MFKNGSRRNPGAVFNIMHQLEQHVERVCAETRSGFDTHVDSEFLLPEPFAYSWHVVLVKEGESVGLQRVIQVHRDAPEELTILLEHEDSKRSIVAVFLLLEIYLGSVVIVRFHCVDGLEGFNLVGNDVVDRYRLAGHFPALPNAKPSDDVDGTPDFQLFEVLDFFAFPRSDVMPGGFDGLATVLCEVFAFSDDNEFSCLGGVVVLDSNAPESSDKFDFVQMFHCIRRD